MKRVEEKFSADKLKVVWIGFQDQKEKIMEYMIKHEIDSSVGFDRRNIISTDYGIAYGAGLIAIDKEGIVRKRIPKGFSEDELTNKLKDIMSGTGK